MNVLSCFDGLSGGQIALNRAGIKYDKYYASEIDKHAIKVTQHNYPNTIQLGDVTKWREWNIDWAKIGLVLAGSPCQGFSFAGKQLAFDDPRSALFFVFVEIWNHVKKHNPDAKFLLENVKMKKEHELVISNYMGIAPIEINSALVSAQNRERLYWSNISAEPYGLFGDMHCTIPQPKDKGILLRDILETDVPEKYYLSEKMIQYFNKSKEEHQRKGNGFGFSFIESDSKSNTILSRYYKDGEENVIKVDTNLKKSANQDKANCFTAGGNSGGLHSDMTLIVASRGRGEHGETEQQLEPRNDGKTNCLTGVQKDNLVLEQRARGNNKGGLHRDKCPTLTSNSFEHNHSLVFTNNYLQYDVSGKGYKSQQDRAFYETGNHACLSASRSENKTGVVEGGNLNRIRRLTPTECERLQTVEDGYTLVVSDTQRYRMLGNGWNIDTIVHILSYMKTKA